jgi:flagellar biosynthesis protein FlhF
MSYQSINPDPRPPGTYRFSVSSAAEGAQIIRDQLGPTARVLSVRAEPRAGFARWLGPPRFEVIAELPVAVDPDIPAIAALAPAAKSRPENGEQVPGPEAQDPDVARNLLRRVGVPEKLIVQLTPSGRPRSGDEPLHRILANLTRDLRQATARSPVALPARTAFLGGAGVGRTTALCKWLAHTTLGQGKQATVWRVEFEQPNPTPQLDVFAEALGVAMEHYAEGLSQAYPDGDALLVDLPALPSLGSAEAKFLTSFLDREAIDGRVLVLNALYEVDSLRESYARGRAFGATHLVFTHLDELARWGRLWEFLWEGELSPLFASTGPALMGDFDEGVLEAVLRRTLPGAERGGR